MFNKKSLIEKIKKKKELSDIEDSLISEILENYLKKHKINLENLKEKEIKIIVKEIRSQLRLLTGRFQKSLKNKLKLLEKNKLSELLKTHASTAERLSFYPKLKKIISKLNPSSILDLACGLNPIALASPKIKYYASDIKSSELNLIREFFKKNKIKGSVFVYNLRDLSKPLPKADICLLFKTLDIIEDNPRNLAEKLIKKLNCKYIIISFSTRTLSGKPMRYLRRYWLENLLKKLSLSYKTFSSDNEIFYLVEK